MPIIAGRASAAYGAGFAAITASPYAGPFGAYDSLASITLDSTTTSVSFTAIPDGYKHLQIRAIAKNSAAASGYDYIHATYNADTGNNYSLHYIYGNGAGTTSTFASGNTGLAYSRVGNLAQNNTTSVFGTSIIDIFDYASTVKNKTIRSLSGHDANGNNSDGVIHAYSSSWFNTTSPITSIRLFPANGSFVAYSSFALYGVK